MKLTPNAAQALTNLRGNQDFSAFLEWLREHKAMYMDTCVDADGLLLHRAQGSAKTLKHIQTAYDEAPATLQKLKS